MDSSILVTGGAGFIGSHISLKLFENGYDVILVDSFISSSSKGVENIQKYIKKKYPSRSHFFSIFKGDIREYDLLNKIFSNAKKIGKSINGVIHLAGFKSVYESIEKPLLYYDNNLCGTINLLKCMELHNCKTIVFSSSASIYDQNNYGLINEEKEINPNNPYAKTKAIAELILEDIFKSNCEDWKIANLRYFNPLGAHPESIVGEELTLDSTNLFPNIIKVALKIKNEINIFGNDWPTKDGTCVRDYIHIMDLAEGHIRALKLLFSKKNYFINLNLGTGNGQTVLEVIRTFEETNLVKIPYVFKERRVGDNAKVVADNSLAKKILNWSPSLSLEDMCRDSWKWENKDK